MTWSVEGELEQFDPAVITRLFAGLAGVAFDFDGVLVDSVDVKTEAFLALYAQESDAFRSEIVRHHLAFGGITRRVKISHFERLRTGSAPDESLLESLVERFADIVKARVIAAPEMPGAQALLEFLAPRLPLFVCSGTPEGELREIVAARGWADHFVGIHGAPTSKSVMLESIVRRLRCAPGDLLMIGDAATDRDAARVVGARFLLVAPGDGASPSSLSEPCIAHPGTALEVLRTTGLSREPPAGSSGLPGP